jgi:hypothetical protein
VIGNIRTPALISFTRVTAANSPAQLDPTGKPLSYKYLENSTYDITYSNGELDGYWLDHPETGRKSAVEGTCPTLVREWRQENAEGRN